MTKPDYNHVQEHKEPVDVKINLTSGDSVGGVLFLKQHQRITDLLNDDRDFIPLKDGDGYIHVIAKNNIEKVFIKDKRESEIE